MTLATTPNLADPDAFYALLMQAHRGLDEDASRRLDAALVLLLANHVGDMAVLAAAVQRAREAVAAMPAEQGLAAEGRGGP
ncbi:DUF2783 domain-containing protein [Paracraurococcus ruber]|uniref:DNA topoisomerase IV n=1 Tax=Paracraurococcus ruber TaxID=77675 RepID=A0ABS1CRT9_9PROT|nr:DUF2783 domain-containing protein [Paracraurococcus ruber]MBK1657078.1 DNA topoisomerase IV [Paracraurococcus ruber]TDG33377.1 DUF2783 domain-containing protein [Paracraurococcus ruber]